MPKKKLLFKELRAEVDRLVKQWPGNLYRPESTDMCAYTRGKCTNDTVGCIFGQALMNLRPNLKDFLNAVDNGYAGCPTAIDGVLMHLAEKKIVGKFGLYDLVWAREVQSFQDTGKRWKKAVALADKAVEEKKKLREEYDDD